MYDDGTEINPLYVRHQMCLASLTDLKNVDNMDDKINGVLCCLSAYYDGVSEQILNMYFDYVEIPYVDPVVERECRDQVNVFHVADLLRIVEPLSDIHWIDPENSQAFRVLVDNDFSEFLTRVRTESRQFRDSIDNFIQGYIDTHN